MGGRSEDRGRSRAKPAHDRHHCWDTVNALKKGTKLNISVQNQAGREMTFAVPLAGFGKSPTRKELSDFSWL